jgi:hypothetical protein
MMRRRGVTDLGAARAFAQGEAAQAALLEQAAAGRDQRFTQLAVVIGPGGLGAGHVSIRHGCGALSIFSLYLDID